MGASPPKGESRKEAQKALNKLDGPDATFDAAMQTWLRDQWPAVEQDLDAYLKWRGNANAQTTASCIEFLKATCSVVGEGTGATHSPGLGFASLNCTMWLLHQGIAAVGETHHVVQAKTAMLAFLKQHLAIAAGMCGVAIAAALACDFLTPGALTLSSILQGVQDKLLEHEVYKQAGLLGSADHTRRIIVPNMTHEAEKRAELIRLGKEALDITYVLHKFLMRTWSKIELDAYYIWQMAIMFHVSIIQQLVSNGTVSPATLNETRQECLKMAKAVRPRFIKYRLSTLLAAPLGSFKYTADTTPYLFDNTTGVETRSEFPCQVLNMVIAREIVEVAHSLDVALLSDPPSQ